MLKIQEYAELVALLQTSLGWMQVALIAACVGIGWLIDRQIRLRTDGQAGVIRVGIGSVNRIIFPLVTLLLLAAARWVFRKWYVSQLLDLALPLVAALAAVRVVVYVLRSQFAPSSWLIVSEKVLAYGIWIALVLYLTDIHREVIDQLEDVRFQIGKHKTSVWQIGSAACLIVVTILGSRWLSGVIEKRLMTAEQIDISARVVMSKVVRALLLLGGVIFALSAVGIDLTVLSVFGGALGVGLGFGLQKIASNYISGFMILFDRSIRLGDLITVDNRFGIVSRLTARYVVVRSLDGLEAIIPNETLVTTTVVNHSYSNSDARLGIPVQVAYDTPIQEAMAILEEVGLQHPRTLKTGDKAPRAYMVRFAENGIDLELGVWIADPQEGQLNLRSDINQAVWRRFQEAGIKVPYPQREVRVLGPLPPVTAVLGNDSLNRGVPEH